MPTVTNLPVLPVCMVWELNVFRITKRYFELSGYWVLTEV